MPDLYICTSIDLDNHPCACCLLQLCVYDQPYVIVFANVILTLLIMVYASKAYELGHDGHRYDEKLYIVRLHAGQ